MEISNWIIIIITINNQYLFLTRENHMLTIATNIQKRTTTHRSRRNFPSKKKKIIFAIEVEMIMQTLCRSIKKIVKYVGQSKLVACARTRFVRGIRSCLGFIRFCLTGKCNTFSIFFALNFGCYFYAYRKCQMCI